MYVKRAVMLGALCAALTFQGCTQGPSGSAPRSSGSIALSTDDSFLYAADTDNGVVAVVDTKANQKVAEVKVGTNPTRVLVGPDDTIYVTNRGSRTVSVIHKGEWSEAARLDVGIEPTGLAFAHGGKTLLVTSSTSLDSPEVGTLMAFDTSTLQAKWSVPVGEEPRAVAVVTGDRAIVSLFKQGDVVEVDLNHGEVLQRSAGVRAAANPASSVSSYGSSTFAPRAINDLIVSPDGTRAFAPVVWAREDAITKRPSSAGGYYGAGGPCNIGAVATAGLVTFDSSSAPTPKVDDLTSCYSTGLNTDAVDFPTSTLAPKSFSTGDAIQGPTVGVIDTTGTWLYVVNRESKNVAVLPAFRRDGPDLDFTRTGTSVRSLVTIGNGADGIALSADGKHAYVYNQFDHRVDTLSNVNGQLANTQHLTVAADTLAPDLVAGRKLFYDALDPRMSAPLTNVACSTCHLEGREDGHVWEFPDGPRQTPALAGRHLLETAPYHWSGEFSTINKFTTHTITERMGGTGLNDLEAGQLDAYINQLPNSENPLRTGTAASAVARGRNAFEKATCASCHTGSLLTNNENASVGTLNTRGKNPDNGVVMSGGFNVPSLLGLGRTAPYLHDGSQTLADRVFSATGSHGDTSKLSGDEKADLLVYLKSL